MLNQICKTETEYFKIEASSNDILHRMCYV